MRLIYFVFIASFFFLNSCSQKTTNPFLWLTGRWEMRRSQGGTRIETWAQKDDGSLTGKGIRIEGKDTFLLEKIELVLKNNTYWYIPTVPDQNNAQPIEFKLTKSEGTTYTFENEKHDFPQRIIYRYKPAAKNTEQEIPAGDSLLVRVESLAGDGIDYGFERK